MQATRRQFCSALATTAVGGSIASTAHAQTTSGVNSVRFALIGDTPYDQTDERLLRTVLAGSASEAEFIIHAGDIKAGSEPCDNALLRRRIALLDSAPRPLIVVPGDNEWVDCSRPRAGRHNPLERLKVLRHMMYGGGNPLGTPGPRHITLERANASPEQGNSNGMPDPNLQPEYTRFEAGPCLFVTLNVPGSDNAIRGGISPTFNRQRAVHNARWLTDSVRVARQRRLAGLVVVLHAEVDADQSSLADFAADVIEPRNPFAWVRALLVRATATFPGKVLLLHGDKHRLINDFPLSNLASEWPDKRRRCWA